MLGGKKGEIVYPNPLMAAAARAGAGAGAGAGAAPEVIAGTNLNREPAREAYVPKLEAPASATLLKQKEARIAFDTQLSRGK